MDPADIKRLVNMYQRNPEQFDLQQSHLVEVQAAALGIPVHANTEAEEFDLINTAKQAVYGIVKGGTGILDPGVSDRPRNVYEEYAKSLGELGGFLGLMFTGVGEVAGVIGTGARLAQSAEFLAKGALAVERAAGTVRLVAEGGAALKSLPILAGEKLVSAFGAERAARVAATIGGYFGGSEAAVGIASQALKGGLRMAGAGAVSAVTLFDGKTIGETVHDVISGGMYGLMFGGAMDAVPANALAKLPWVKDNQTASMVLRSILGSATNALPAAASGADGYKIAYEAAVGAFFGAKSLTWQEHGFHEIYAEHDKGEWGTAITSNTDAQRYFDNDIQKLNQYQDFIESLHAPKSVGNIFREFEERFAAESTMKLVTTPDMVHEIANLGYTKFGMGDRFTDGVTEYTEVGRALNDDMSVRYIIGRTDDGREVNVPVQTRLEESDEPLPETSDVLPVEPPLTNSRREGPTHEPFVPEPEHHVGDMVSIENGAGVTLKNNARVTAVSTDGSYVQVEGSKAYVPVSWVKQIPTEPSEAKFGVTPKIETPKKEGLTDQEFSTVLDALARKADSPVRTAEPWTPPSQLSPLKDAKAVEPWAPTVLDLKPKALPSAAKTTAEVAPETGVLAGGRLAIGGPTGAFRRMAIEINNIVNGTPGANENFIRAHTNNLWREVMRHATAQRNTELNHPGVGFDALLASYVNSPVLVASRNGKLMTAEDLKPLIPMWNSLTQRITHEHMYWNAKEGKLVTYSQQKDSSMAINGSGDMVDTSGARNFIHVITGDDSATITIAGYLDKDGNYDDLSKGPLSIEDLNTINNQLMERGYYLFSGGADKSMFVGVKWIDQGVDIQQFLTDHLEQMGEEYRADYEAFALASGMSRDVFDRTTVNNILYYEKMNNMTVGEAFKSEGMIRKVVDFNKRMQPLLTNFYQLDPNVLAHFVPKGKKLNYHLVLVRDDSDKPGGNNRPTENTDGTTTAHSRNIKAHGWAMGIPKGESHLKSFILHYSDRKDVGTLINKHGEQSATPGMDTMLDDADLGYVSRVSGSKQYGNRTIYRMRINDGKLEFSEGNYDEPFVPVPREQLDVTELSPKDFRISSTIHDDTIASLNHAITYPKQAIYHQTIYETGPAAIKAHMDWIVKTFTGDEKYNTRLSDYLAGNAKDRKPGEFAKLLEHFDSLGVQDVLNVMVTDPHGMGKLLFKKIIQVSTNSEEGLVVKMNDGEDNLEIPDGLSGVKRMIAFVADHNILYSRLGRKVTEQAMTRFVVNRLTKPRVLSAGHSTMHGNGQDMVEQINQLHGKPGEGDALTTENFFLDNGKKDLRIKGVVFDPLKKGETKRGWTTLDLQLKSFKKAEARYERALAANGGDESKIDAKVLSDYKEMEKALYFSVTRVPIDSFSGSVRLHFAGFTGMEGGAILLHGRIKEQLGGADNDGDTAYYYHGLPDEYLDSLERAKNNFSVYAKVIDERSALFNTDEKRVFFTDGEGVYAEKKESRAGTFNSIFRSVIGHNVSKGRGEMLPIAVKYVDLVKKLLDTAYSQRGTLNLHNDNYEIHLTARDYDPKSKRGTGKTLGAYGQRAINSAADAGKEAGMVSQELMQSTLLTSAFKRVELTTYAENEAGELVPQRTTLFDADKSGGDFNRGNLSTVLDPLLQVVSRDGTYRLSGTEVGKYEHFISTMFGYNTADHRPWTLDEVNDAAANVPKMFKTPYTDIIPLLRDTKFSDGLLHRVLPKQANFLKFLSNVREFAAKNRALADSILDGGVVVEYKHLTRLLDLYNQNYDVGPRKTDIVHNLATSRGMRNFARDDERFKGYLDERLKIWKDYPNQMTLDAMQRKYGAFWTYDEAAHEARIQARKNDKTKRDYTRAERKEIREEYRLEPIVQNRVKFLRDEYYQVSDYLSSRIEDIGSMMFIRRKTDQAGITPQDMHAIESVIPDDKLSASLIKNFSTDTGEAQMKPSLLDLVKMIKYSQDMFHKKEWTENALGLSVDKFGKELALSSQKAMNLALSAEGHVANITARINEARAARNEPPVKQSDMVELYEALMVSTVMKGGGTKTTGQQMFGLNAVSDKTIHEYARTMADVFKQSQKNPKWVKITKMFQAYHDLEARHDVTLGAEAESEVPSITPKKALTVSHEAPIPEEPPITPSERRDLMSAVDQALLTELEELDKIPWDEQTEEQSAKASKLRAYLDNRDLREEARAELRKIQTDEETDDKQDRVLELERVISGEPSRPPAEAARPFVEEAPEYEYELTHEERENVPPEFVPPERVAEEGGEKKAVKEEKPPKIVKILGHFKRRLDAADLDPRNRTPLTEKEKAIVDPIWDFIKANRDQFPNGLQDVVKLFNGMLGEGGYNNPNQYKISEMEGLANHFKRLKKYNTIFSTLADLSTPGKKEGQVNWMTWMQLPVTSARKFFGLDKAFYLKHQPIFGAGGKLDASATLKKYQDDKGKLHEVYADAAVPMNVLLRNLNAHTAMDYVQGEMGNKLDAIYARIMTFLSGGVKVAEGDAARGFKKGEDVTKFIREYAILGREMEGAELDGDTMAKSEFKKRKDPLEERYARLKDMTLRFREGGKDVHMTGEQLHTRIRGALDELASEYRKFVVMEDADIKHFFVLAKDGSVDLRETSKRFDGLLNQRKVERVASYDTMSFFNYLMTIDHYAGEAIKTHVARSSEDVDALEMLPNKERLREMLPFIGGVRKAEMYLKAYTKAMRGAADPNFNERTAVDPGADDLFKKAKYHAEIDKLRKKEMETDSRIPGTEHMEVIKDLRRYFRHNVSGTLVKVYGDALKKKIGYELLASEDGERYARYSQYQMDKALASGAVSTKEYYTAKLLNEYRFRETELLSGWFPHRNFDPKALEAHLKRNYEEAVATEPITVPDEQRFLETQNTLRTMLGETKDPASIDDGKIFDSMLSKTGYAPLEHVVGSTPGALKSRTANFDGYSMNPYEMRMAIASVQRSGLAKLTATLNNDAILKFEARAGRLENGVPALDPKLVRPWVEYIRHIERQAFNRPSIFTNEMLNNPLVRIKWTPAYWFSDHAMLASGGSMLNRWYRQLTKADAVTDLERVLFKKRTGRNMTEAEIAQRVKEREDRFLDFSVDPQTGEYTPKALKNMETAAVMFKRFSQFEAKIELSSLLFHTKFAVANIYGGVANDYIYNGFAPLRKGRDIAYWNAINSDWKTMADVQRFFHDSGVIESIILKDAGYTGELEQGAGVMEKITAKSSFFMRKTETYLRREAAMHGYIAAREALGEMGEIPYNSEYLLSMARHSVEATQFLYNNHNRPAFMATNLGKVFTRFKLWGLNSLRMQGDIVNYAADQGFRKGTVEMARFQRMYMANLFMFGLALMFPHTIFESQLPQPVDSMASLSGVFFGDDEKNKQKRKNLFNRMEDPIRDMVVLPTKIPGISFPFARAPLALYDAPAMFRAIWSHDVNDMASATTMNILPFGRLTKDVLAAYQNPMMATDILAGIPLHRINYFYSKAKKQQMQQELLEEEKANRMQDEGF